MNSSEFVLSLDLYLEEARPGRASFTLLTGEAAENFAQSVVGIAGVSDAVVEDCEVSVKIETVEALGMVCICAANVQTQYKFAVASRFQTRT